jgi:hypothetical protein
MLYFACGSGAYYARQVGGRSRFQTRALEISPIDNPGMAPEDETICLLQSLEHALETIARLTTVTEQLIAAQLGNSAPSADALDEYSRQLVTVRRDSDRLRAALGAGGR